MESQWEQIPTNKKKVFIFALITLNTCPYYFYIILVSYTKMTLTNNCHYKLNDEFSFIFFPHPSSPPPPYTLHHHHDSHRSLTSTTISHHRTPSAITPLSTLHSTPKFHHCTPSVTTLLSFHLHLQISLSCPLFIQHRPSGKFVWVYSSLLKSQIAYELNRFVNVNMKVRVVLRVDTKL